MEAGAEGSRDLSGWVEAYAAAEHERDGCEGDEGRNGLASGPPTSAGGASFADPQVWSGRTRGLSDDRDVRRWNAGRDLHRDGEGRLDSVGRHGLVRNNVLDGVAVRGAVEGSRRQVHPHTV